MKTKTLVSNNSVASPNLIDQLCRNILFKKLSSLKEGSVEIEEVFSGNRITFGQTSNQPELNSKMRILDSRAYSRIVFGGSIGAGEGYIHQEWESDDLTQLIRVFARSRELQMALDSGIGSVLAPVQKIFHKLRKNSISGSRKNIEAHYDLGNDFFELFLDSSWMYSSAYYKTAKTTLEEAQFEKLDRICRRLDLKPGDRVIEIGTGWGSFAIHAAKHFGCHVTTTTISTKQRELALVRVKEAGVSDLVEVLFEDYRLLKGTYDKLVSIEMIEAVGLDHLDVYFEKCSSLIKPGGQMLIQAITIRDENYEIARKNVDFIQRYIFPGSGIPAVAAMMQSVKKKTNLQIVHLEDFGHHYARTLNEWHLRLNQKKAQMFERGYSEQLYRMWRFYFSYCEGGFLERSIGVSQIQFQKPGYNSGVRS